MPYPFSYITAVIILWRAWWCIALCQTVTFKCMLFFWRWTPMLIFNTLSLSHCYTEIQKDLKSIFKLQVIVKYFLLAKKHDLQIRKQRRNFSELQNSTQVCTGDCEWCKFSRLIIVPQYYINNWCLGSGLQSSEAWDSLHSVQHLPGWSLSKHQPIHETFSTFLKLGSI